MTPSSGLLVHVEAKDGKQDQVAAVLNGALATVAREPGTATWYAYRITDTEFGIFDTFFDEDARGAHLAGDAGAALARISEDLLAREPVIQRIDIVAAKV